MISLQQIEKDMITAMKAKDSVAVGVLRGLKTRIQNEKVSKMVEDLGEDEILALVRSEIKKRKEAAQGFEKGGNVEAKDKELAEAEILSKFLPPQMSEEELGKIADAVIAEGGFIAADFGKAMGVLKAKAGNNADGASLAKVLKEKLK
ncbi:MAG: GatB/YqeY domain-containing protein [Candidatus Doudnabacteria bacterium]|nr:GatB/YqeY domain-containing protein [Candidatus Doudnabacteria bacterium]